MTHGPKVTICIPAYEAESFIARTIGFATGQTLRDIRILISIDKSADQTAEVCNQIARTDPRIEVIELKERVGWAGNVAELLRRVDTPYFFLYFHDDILSPHYCARMIEALEDRPDAASANCSVALLDRKQRLVPAHSFAVDATERMLEALGNSQVPGAPLRSMIRTDRFEIDGMLRKGTAPGEMFQAYCLHTAIMLAGTAIGVNDYLYLRWIRDNALVSSAPNPGIDQLMSVWLENFARLWPYMQHRIPDQAALKLVQHTFVLRAVLRLRHTPDFSTAALAALWQKLPYLPQVEDAPLLDRIDPKIAQDVQNLRMKVGQSLNPMPERA